MKKKSLMHSIAAAPHVFWAVLFIVLPLIIVLFYAFTDAEGNFSFENILGLADYGNIFLLSVELSIIATFICLLIGYPLAYIIAKADPKKQKFFIILLLNLSAILHLNKVHKKPVKLWLLKIIASLVA